MTSDKFEEKLERIFKDIFIDKVADER